MREMVPSIFAGTKLLIQCLDGTRYWPTAGRLKTIFDNSLTRIISSSLIMDLDININLQRYESCYWETRPKRSNINRFEYKRLDKNAKRHRDLNFNLHYLRMQVPLLRILFSEYKMKWEKSQRRRNARHKKVAVDDSDYLSDTSNGSVTSNIAFGYPNAQIDDDIKIEPEDTEPYRTGYYLLLSNEKGGWTYPEVKRYFWQKHGVRCFRSKTINDALKGTNNFKALIKCRNRKALNRVYRILAKEIM